MNADTKKKFGKDLKGLLFDNLDKIGNKFQEIWNGIKDGFAKMWDGLKQLAGDGINAVIKLPNDGIDGINSLIHDFGGPKNAIGKIPKVKFANGTGFFNGYRNVITRPTLATLNDGHDSQRLITKKWLFCQMVRQSYHKAETLKCCYQLAQRC